MAIRQLKPVTPASRFTSRPDFSEITTSVPLQPGKIYQLKAENYNNDCLIVNN